VNHTLNGVGGLKQHSSDLKQADRPITAPLLMFLLQRDSSLAAYIVSYVRKFS
jgi:hypothetical protein